MSRHPSAPPPADMPYPQVAAAAENLEGRGADPTLQRVCKHLGGGSPNLIQRHLATWRASREAPAPPSPRLPKVLIEALERELVQQASAAYTSRERQIEEAQADATTLAELGEALERRVAEQEAQLAVAEQTAREAQAQRDDLQEERAQVRENLEGVLQSRQQVEMLREQLEEAVQARLAAERQARDADAERIKAERGQAVAETQRDSVLAQVREKAELHAGLHKELQAERARHRQEVAELRAEQKQRFDALERARHEAQKQAQEAAQRAAKTEIRAEALQATQAALKSRLDALQVQQRQRGSRPTREQAQES
ncbi:DNA-binding protein [Halomonas sp. BM-2019]|uniref:DNA-binding protein n=1 Tax=Halomonas sp. BM-2019 TaxID=2811227 RepID=UPI001B3C34DD|nr:MAG: DNA-binding protein [Halomonas sp. BM-2019]